MLKIGATLSFVCFLSLKPSLPLTPHFVRLIKQMIFSKEGKLLSLKFKTFFMCQTVLYLFSSTSVHVLRFLYLMDFKRRKGLGGVDGGGCELC